MQRTGHKPLCHSIGTCSGWAVASSARLNQPNQFATSSSPRTRTSANPARRACPARSAGVTSDYHLTRKITCPQCGQKYLGTSATGKLRRYRYYTCFTRNRYGTAKCNAPRINADQFDHALFSWNIDLTVC